MDSARDEFISSTAATIPYGHPWTTQVFLITRRPLMNEREQTCIRCYLVIII